MPAPSLTYTLTNGTTADASQVMQNFNDLLNGYTDGTKDLSISALTVAGAAVFNGNTTIGNASGDDLTVTASLASTIPIKTTNTYNIGSATLGLAGVYFGTGSTQTARIVAASSYAGALTYTLPDLGSAGTFAFLEAAQSFTGLKKFEGDLARVGTINTSNTNVTLTNASSRHITFNSFSASRDVTLPTTSILAGEIFVLENTTAFDMVVKASGGSALTVANSANCDATVQKGYVVVKSLQATPTTPAHWQVMEVVEMSYAHTVAFAGNGAGAGGGGSISSTLHRHNNLVTFRMPTTWSGTSGTGSDRMSSDNALPTRFRALASTGFHIYMIDAGTHSSGLARFNTNGLIDLFKSSAGASFTNSSTIGPVSALHDSVVFAYKI